MRKVLAIVASIFLVAYIDPSRGGHVLEPANIPEHNWQPGHQGVNLALPVGSEVIAAGDGRVVFSGVVAGRPSVSILHPDGIRTTYTPVRGIVKNNDEVEEGQVIGHLVSGDEEGLHWGALTGKDRYIDPLTLLDDPVIRLKPVDGPDETPPLNAAR